MRLRYSNAAFLSESYGQIYFHLLTVKFYFNIMISESYADSIAPKTAESDEVSAYEDWLTFDNSHKRLINISSHCTAFKCFTYLPYLEERM